MTMTATGIITKINSKFATLSDGQSYSLPRGFNPASFPGWGIGAEVTLQYTPNVSPKNGQTYLNVVPNGITVSGVAPAAPIGTPPPSGGGHAPSAAAKAPGEVILDRQRSIIRQSSVNYASHVVGQIVDNGWVLEDIADAVLDVAKRFEAYCSGDADLELALKLLDGGPSTKDVPAGTATANPILGSLEPSMAGAAGAAEVDLESMKKMTEILESRLKGAA